MDNDGLLKRLHQVEQELQALREALEPPEENKWKERAKKISRSLLKNWLPVTVIAGAIVAQLFFGVSPFENYRAIRTTHALSKFYSNLGDKLLFRQEWDAAEEAYRTALDIDKNNTQATYGILKAQVFQPLEGQKYYAVEVADTKLDYLEEKKELRNDYQVYFLRGIYYFNQPDYVEAKRWLTKATDENPRFAAGYIMRGYVRQTDHDIQGACSDYNAAFNADRGDGVANNNVGDCYLLEGHFLRAIEHLWIAWKTSQRLGTLMSLGDALLFTRHTDEALGQYQDALSLVEDQGESIENERIVSGEWTYNFLMPENRKAPDGMKEYAKKVANASYVKASGIEHYRIFLHYNLGFGYALNGNLDAATTEFNAAQQLDKDRKYSEFFENKMEAIVYYVKPNDYIRNWFEAHEGMLLAMNP